MVVPYDPASEPVKTVNLAVSVFTLLAITGTGGLALAGAGGVLGVAGYPGGTKTPASKAPSGGKVASASVKFLKGGAEDVAVGDRSWTWRLPGTDALDRLSFALPGWLGPNTPMLARLGTDGSYLRAVFGSAYLLFPVLGIVLGAAAAGSAAGQPVPVPSTELVLGLLVLGVVDAASGLLGVVAFALGLLFAGQLGTPGHLRLLMGIGGMWSVTPLLAGAARPLRRVPARTLEHLWDRSADVVVASLVGAWAVQKIVLGLPGLAGARLPLTASANTCALIVLVALAGRIAAETLAASYYPRRLADVQPAMILKPGPKQRLLATLLRTGIFVFVAIAFVGPLWQLWVGALLFIIPQVLGVYEEKFPNRPQIFHWMPRGILKTVVMLFVGKWTAILLLGLIANSHQVLADAFVVLALPGLALSIVGLFGRDGVETPLTWWHRAAGAAVLATGILFVLGFVG